MNIACHTSGFGDLSLDQIMGTVARLGFCYVDLAPINLAQAAAQPDAEAAAIRALLREFNLTLTDVCLSLPAINAPEPAERESALSQFEKLLPFAVALGAPGITVSPGGVHADGQEHSLARSVPALLRMKHAVEAAAPGLRLSIEPGVDSLAESPADALLLLDCVPGLRLTLDYAQFIFRGLTRKDITPLISKAAHIQIRQAVKNRLQTGFELGSLDMREIVEDLQEAGYRGAVSIEYLNTPGERGVVAVNIIEETVKTRDALRNARLAVMR